MSDAARAVTCPSCGGTVQVRAAGFSVTLVCEYCGSVLDVANPDVAMIEKHNRAAAQLAMPLGSRGAVFGTEFQVVGWMRRSIDGEGWDEYLLFNPYVGYRWLVEEDGEWSFGTMLLALPDVSRFPTVLVGAAAFRNEEQSYVATVDSVVGEFYWRVQVGDTVQLVNFEGGAATLSRESVADEVNWTVSKRLRPGDVHGFDGGTFDPAAVAPPAAFMRDAVVIEGEPRDSLWPMLKIGGATAAFLILIMAIASFGGMKPQSFTYTVMRDGAAQSATFGPLVFRGGRQKVEINTTSSDFDNAWIDLDIALVERTTQATIEAASVVEKYSGTDSDGAWSEGSRSKSTKIASVPSGTYDLVIEAAAKSWPAPQAGYGYVDGGALTLTTTISSGGVFASNLFLALIMLAIPPIWLIYRRMKRSGMLEGDDDD
jgi:Domain of unknown function (DUF4178)